MASHSTEESNHHSCRPEQGRGIKEKGSKIFSFFLDTPLVTHSTTVLYSRSWFKISPPQIELSHGRKSHAGKLGLFYVVQSKMKDRNDRHVFHKDRFSLSQKLLSPCLILTYSRLI